MTKVYGSLVVKNEIGRYLKPCIDWASLFLDEIFVFDDRSTDGSAELARDLGCIVRTRDESTPSFIQHEGQFREAAWAAFEESIRPAQSRDWVLAFDADEFLVSDTDVRESLLAAIGKVESNRTVGIVLPFREIFKVDSDGVMYARIDGFWAKVRGPRLFRYLRNGVWNNKPMGCGSEPNYVSSSRYHSTATCGLSVIHLGYARDADKQDKYSRYSSLVQHGHSDSHIESILAKPHLEEMGSGILSLDGVSFE